MQRLKFMYKQFLKEPLWFKIIAPATLITSIMLSSSLFSMNGYSQSAAKLAAAIFFLSFGIKMRRNQKIAILFLILTVICVYLSWDSFEQIESIK